MKVARIISGIMFAIGFFLIMCVVGANDYYMEMGINHPTNFILAFVGIAMIIPFPVILNTKKGRIDEGKRF